jgi:membrane protease YdiL (CAAX protease family)
MSIMGVLSLAWIRQFVARYPYRSALSFWLLFFLLNIPAGVIGLILTLNPLILVVVADTLVGITGILLVLGLLWWKRAGFSTPGDYHDLILYLLPIGIALISVVEGVTIPAPSMILLFIVFSLVVGFAEETFFRGLILPTLLPVGIWRAVLISAILFAVPHLLNAVGGIWDPLFTVADSVAAFGIGIAFAALLIRTGSIWPLIGIHAFVNFTALLSLGSLSIPAQSTGQLAVTLVVGIMMTIYGVYLLRPGTPVRLPAAVE